jgi:hypothetical protein
MPLGSSKFQNKNVQLGNGPGIPINTAMTLSLTYSGNTGISVEATTLTIDIDSEFANSIVDYEITGNIASGDFTDATLTGNITLDANGNASLNKIISTTTGGGHKDFTFSVVRPGSNVVIANTNPQYIYEIVGAEVTGGDTVDTNSIEAGYHKVHQFTTVGNANLTITSLGNESGNTNVWNTYFRTDSNTSYWDGNIFGTDYRACIIGAGGQWGYYNGFKAGAGAGELGVIKYPKANISTGTFTMQVGGATSANASFTDPEPNTTIFASLGVSDLKITALAGGGDGPFGRGGSGRGGAQEALAFYNTGLAYTGGTWGTNFVTHVVMASGSSGDGYRPYYFNRNGGGGAFGIGGAFVDITSNVNAYGANVSTGNRPSLDAIFFPEESGGHGAIFAANVSANADNAYEQYPNFGNAQDYVGWKYNPVYDGSTRFQVAGGGSARPNWPTNSVYPSIGEHGYGGGGLRSESDVYGRAMDGFISFSYPYANTRFITGTVIT